MNRLDGEIPRRIGWKVRPIEKTWKRIADQAEAVGYENIHETYQRVEHAAQQMGLGPFFRSTNKLLSKFTHPTAILVFSFPDEAARAEVCVLFLTLGSILCLTSMAEFERYAKMAGATTGR